MPESVSVVIPTFCSHETVGRALESVAKQTHRPLEIIVVDDASPTDSLAKLQAQIACHEDTGIQISLLTLPRNLGPGSARNVGWGRAQGTYVAFLDSDDAWHPAKLERQVKLMQCSGAAMSSHAYSADRDMQSDVAGVTSYTFTDFLLKNRCSTPTVVVRRDIPERFQEGKRYSEDYELWLRIARRGPVPALHAELARGFKKPWGDSGLSAHMQAMVAGQYQTYISLARSGCVPRALLPLLLGWSTLRYLRRLLVQTPFAAKGVSRR